MIKILPTILILLSLELKADTQSSKSYAAKNSECLVKSTAGEYSSFTVFKNNKIIFKPKSEGLEGVVFSKDGKYVALGSSEVTMIDVEGKDYHIAIVNCVNEKLVGFNLEIKGVSAAWPKDWSKSNEELEIGYYAKTPGEKIHKLDVRKLKLP